MTRSTSNLTAFCSLAAIAAALVTAAPATAQSASHEVVQPIAPGEVSALNAALQRLAQDPQSVDALIEAGTAALQLGDIDAAIGFFGRADELSPGNPRAKLGMAAGFMRSERPIEALRLFAEAEKAGVSSNALAGDRALAYDLVGDNFHAQQEYRKAIKKSDSPELTRRLALSLAISGDRQGFEDTLLPLLKQRDLAAYRTRAFGLAVLGDTKEAQRIVDAVMPGAMATKLAPYLEYMPRLTKAQQAAAANFGRFPQTGQIGRDDPQLAQYAQPAAKPARQAGAALEPRGAPLGSSRQVATPTPTTTFVTPPPVKVTNTPTPTTTFVAPSAKTASAPAGVVVPPPAPPPPPPVRVVASPPPPPSPPPAPPAPPPPPPAAAVGIGDAFSDFTLPSARDVTTSTPSAVDITTIKPKRELPAPPPPPPPPKHPERIWVQVATGKDLQALAFDWRRLSRKAPDVLGKFEPHTVKWGVANRLLAGPYKTEADAREAMKALKAKGIATFTYTSPEGQAIADLK